MNLQFRSGLLTLRWDKRNCLKQLPKVSYMKCFVLNINMTPTPLSVLANLMNKAFQALYNLERTTPLQIHSLGVAAFSYIIWRIKNEFQVSDDIYELCVKYMYFYIIRQHFFCLLKIFYLIGNFKLEISESNYYI